MHSNFPALRVKRSVLAVNCLVTLLFTAHHLQAQSLPEIYQPGTVSNEGVFGFTLSPDGNRALWVSSGGKRDTLRIMESRKIRRKWTAPAIASFSTARGEWKDIDPVFAPDGKKLLFQSTRNTHRASGRTDFDLWAVDLGPGGWGSPYPLGDSVNSTLSESYASMSRDGTLYFMKENPVNRMQSDIYMAVLDKGQYRQPQPLGHPINTSERESNPFISPEGDYLLYFSSDKYGLGEVDLYISFRHKEGWSAPRNLGAPINSALAEFCPFVHARQRKLYFSRQEKTEGRMKENIWSVDFDPRDYR